jgi:hypothetical protein
MDEDNPDFAISLPINRMGPREVLDRQKLMQRRINGRSKGLLEATELGDSLYPIWKVDFLHRTVRDFLRTKSIEAMLESMAAPTFNANRALSRALLAAYKAKILDLGEQSWMDSFTYFARRAEEHNNIADHAMMEQLEHVCKTQSHLFSSSDISFLEFAIEAGLVRFVASKLDEQPDLLTYYGPSLFKTALRMPTERGQYETDLSPMVQMLLKRGISPNRLCPLQDSQSLFIYWLEAFPYFDTGRVKFQYWSRILKLMLLHGARAQDSAQFFNNIIKCVDETGDKDTAIINETIVEGTAILLSHGLDPNEPNDQGHTFWIEFLKHICADKLRKPMTVPVMLQILTLFLRYGADSTVVDYFIMGGVTRIYWGSSEIGCLCLTTSEHEDEINEFIELIAQENDYHKSQGLSWSRKASSYKSKSIIPAKRKLAVGSLKSSF